MTPALLVALVAIFVLSLALAPRTGAEDGEAFAGTDSQVTGTLTEAGAKPWFSPIFEPGSTEVESGLFALQAALGAGFIGYYLGVSVTREKMRREMAQQMASQQEIQPRAD